jgi:hypothetical protein
LAARASRGAASGALDRVCAWVGSSFVSSRPATAGRGTARLRGGRGGGIEAHSAKQAQH